MYPSILSTDLTPETFHLICSNVNSRKYRLLIGVGIFLLPSFLAFISFQSILQLKTISLWLATGTTALLLLNLTIFLIYRQTKDNRTLIIGYNNIKVLKHTKVLYTIPFESTTITRLNWKAEDGKQYAFIELSAMGIFRMIIGSQNINRIWQKTKYTIDSTVYLIDSTEEWERFLYTLSNSPVNESSTD